MSILPDAEFFGKKFNVPTLASISSLVSFTNGCSRRAGQVSRLSGAWLE